jgi:hypothetical protein
MRSGEASIYPGVASGYFAGCAVIVQRQIFGRNSVGLSI